MSYKRRYYVDACESQEQSYHHFLEGSIHFKKMVVQDNYDALDPDKPIQCPYDKNHQIRACRFPYHLVKCRKTPPYNSVEAILKYLLLAYGAVQSLKDIMRVL